LLKIKGLGLWIDRGWEILQVIVAIGVMDGDGIAVQNIGVI
jgi:hypothetical protein